MKTSNLYKYILLLLVITLIFSCKEEDVFNPEVVNDTVDSIENEKNLGNFISDVVIAEATFQGLIDANSTATEIANAKTDVMNQFFTGNLTVSLSGIDAVSGYVVSNDENGNFFEELIIQDKAENPTIGIRFMIDENPLYITYEFGRKVFINIDGLFLGSSDGVLAIGGETAVDGGGNEEVSKISSLLLGEVLIRSSEIATIVPKEVTISMVTDSIENMFLRFNDMQFLRNAVLGDVPQTFGAESSDQFNGERVLESCEEGSTIILSTSAFASFITQSLPNGQGAVDGILARNFFDDFHIFKLNEPSNVIFENGIEGRCDPDIIFSDNFETETEGELISNNGWTNYIEAGSQAWEAFQSSEGSVSYNESISARVGSFQSDDTISIAWLISPEIDICLNPNTFLTFKTSNSFSDNSELELLISEDWDGTEANITSATWTLLTEAYIVQDGDSFVDWFDSGNVDLACNNQNIHIAFKYTGSGDSDSDGTYELDEIVIGS